MKRHVHGADEELAAADSEPKLVHMDTKSSELSLAAPTTIATSASAATLLGSTTSAPKSVLHREDSFRRIATAPVPFGSLLEATGYVAFLVLFIVTTTSVDDHVYGFYFANRLKSAIVEQTFDIPLAGATTAYGCAQKRFATIQDQTDLWGFLQGPFADVVYGLEDNSSAGTSSQSMLLSYNFVIGGVRMRTLRVVADSCPTLSQIPQYSAVVPFCYGDFTHKHEQTASYGPILNSEDVVASLCYAFADAFFAPIASTKAYADLQVCYTDCPRSCAQHFGDDQHRYASDCATQCGIHCKCIYEQPVGFSLCADPNPNGANAAIPTSVYAYNWSSESSTGLLSTEAYTATYPGSGYVMDLPLNGSVARDLLQQLESDRFIDLATRALVLDFTVYNAYLRLFNIVQFTFEFPPTGGTYVQQSDIVLNLFRYSPANTPRIVLELLLVAYIVRRCTVQLRIMYRHGVIRVLRSSIWQVLTTLHLLVFLTVIAVRLYVIDQVYGTLSGQIASAISSASLDSVPTFQRLARLQYVDDLLNSINAALVWLKLLQYAQVSKRMCLLFRMLHRASVDFGWFLVYFLVCIGAFAQVGFLLFGLDVHSFRSFGVAMLTLLQAVAGDLDYSALVGAHAVLGPVFYISFYLVLLLILLNVFLAILNDAYLQTITEQEEDDEQAEAFVAFGDDLDPDNGPQNDADALDNENVDVEAHLQRKTQKDMQELRRYPFSRGPVPAFRLLLIEIMQCFHSVRRWRSNRQQEVKINPLLVLATTTGASPSSTVAPHRPIGSRKFTVQVKKELESQLRAHQKHDRQMQQEKARELQQASSLTSAATNELSDRLSTLMGSHEQKTQRLQDLEKLMGSIEGLCQRLVADCEDLGQATPTMRAMPTHPRATSPSSSLPSSASGQRTRRSTTVMNTKPNNLSMSLLANRQKKGGGSKRSVEDVEEITL